MNATDPAFDPTPLPRLKSVRAMDDLRVCVVWSEGARVGVEEMVDLAPLINKFKLYAPLRNNQKVFSSARLDGTGHSIEWLDGEIDMAATSVERFAGGSRAGEDFSRFLKAHKLTRAAAAAELGRSLRAIQSYTNSTEPLPRVVALACRGYEAGVK